MQKVMLIFLYLVTIIFCSAYNYSVPPPQVNWLTLDEAVLRMHKEKKPILIDLYTDWCGWCKIMDKKTYSNKRVADYLENKFYAVRINAETREKINWNNQSFGFNPNYRANDFAIYLTQGKLEFPTTIFIPTDGSPPQAIPGYLAPKDFELLVKYFGENAYGRIPFDEYRTHFQPSW